MPAYALGWPGVALSSPPNGDPDVATISMSAMTLVCLGVNLRLAIEVHSWTCLEVFIMVATLISIELAGLLFSFAWYPSSLAVSYDWNEYAR